MAAIKPLSNALRCFVRMYLIPWVNTLGVRELFIFSQPISSQITTFQSYFQRSKSVDTPRPGKVSAL